jgi:probable lipoprotein NlpC
MKDSKIRHFDWRIPTLLNHICLILVLLSMSSCVVGKKKRERQQKIDTIIETARSYTGTPYKYGGTQRTGMDCSGLLLVSFKSAGVDIPRTSEMQSKAGKKVNKQKVKEGDLVFFAMGKKRKEITHVGLVTEVRGPEDVRFIHSSTSLGVVEANLFTDYYQKRYRKARRLF